MHAYCFYVMYMFISLFGVKFYRADVFCICKIYWIKIKTFVLYRKASKTRKNCFRYLKLMSPLKNNYLTLKSKSHEGHYGMRHTAVWSCTHIPNIIDLSGMTKKLWSGQASLRRSGRRKNQTKTICLPSFEGET